MKHKVDLEWYAFVYDWNNKELKKINVFRGDFSNNISKRIKDEKIKNYNEFKEVIKRMLMYRYWSKAEYEVLVTDLTNKIDENTDMHKIDIWFQLEPNLDRICEYLINKMDIKLGGDL